MKTPIWGIVKQGLVVPSAPLPESARVEIRLADSPPEIPPEFQPEFEAWDRASAQALDWAERATAEAGQADEAR